MTKVVKRKAETNLEMCQGLGGNRQAGMTTMMS